MLAACRCEMIEPAAQQKAAASRISTMPGSKELAPVPWEGPDSVKTATPARPGLNAINVEILGRSAADIINLRRTIQNGTVASMTAANPEGTNFPAKASAPRQKPNNRMPLAADSAQARAVGSPRC